MDGYDFFMEFFFYCRNVNVERFVLLLVEFWLELFICSGLGGENVF